MTRLCLVTGVPGVGKSTACRLLRESRPNDYRHISFGELIADALSDLGTAVTERDLRQEVTRHVTPAVLAAATDKLVAALETPSDDDTWILIDSHAVSPDWYGFVATPDGQSYFSRVRYAAIIHLFSSPADILARSASETSGRRNKTETYVAMTARLLETVSLTYSSLSECPAYFLSAEGTAEQTAENIHSLLRGER